MNRSSGTEFLPPVGRWLILNSLLFGLLGNMLFSMGFPAGFVWHPDLLALVMLFWCVHQPRRVGIWVCFALGLVSDVQETTWLGQNALIYTLMGFVVTQWRHRLQSFSWLLQAPQLWLVFALGLVIDLLVHQSTGRVIPGWGLWAAPFIQAALWVPVSWLLLRYQTPDPQLNRPS